MLATALWIGTSALLHWFLWCSVIHQPSTFAHALINLDVLQIKITRRDLHGWCLILLGHITWGILFFLLLAWWCVKLFIYDWLSLMPVPDRHFFIKKQTCFVGQLVSLFNLVAPCLFLGELLELDPTTSDTSLGVIFDFVRKRSYIPKEIYTSTAGRCGHAKISVFVW